MALPIVLVLAMLALTPLGHWQMDELLMMRAFRDRGLSALFGRITSWSPRPLSETLLYVYSSVVHTTGRQLTGTFLLCLWNLLILACLVPAALVRTNDLVARRAALLVALTVLALFVCGHPVAEVFYWSQAAAAYIPSIALIAAPLLCLVLAGHRTGRLDGLVAGCVSLAAMASEVGAFFAVAFGAAGLLLSVGGRWRDTGALAVRRRDAMFLAPLLAGLTILFMLANARFGSEAEIFDATIARHLLPSIGWSLSTFPADALAIDLGPSTPQGFALGLVSRAALLVLCVFAFSRIPGTEQSGLRLVVACFALAALASALFSLFAAYYQFGVNCCERHQTIRSQLVVVALVAVGWLLAWSPWAVPLRHRGVAWMAVASVVAVASSAAHMPAAIAHDIARYGEILQARAANWQDALSPDPEMKLRLSHRGEIIGSIYAPAGDFRDEDATPRPLRAMMQYFGKSRIIAE
ncbi:hypothetical protein ACLNGM_18820 [Aureimonas phyllosphaerae]|uniref:hypothetical protein n=1 Tax=Aureimonas phyllosphaerae TaxID=1166078 RepID=UPI003A5BBA7D